MLYVVPDIAVDFIQLGIKISGRYTDMMHMYTPSFVAKQGRKCDVSIHQLIVILVGESLSDWHTARCIRFKYKPHGTVWYLCYRIVIHMYIYWIRYRWKWHVRYMCEWQQYMTSERVCEAKKWTSHIFLERMYISDMSLSSITHSVYQKWHQNKQQLQRGYRNIIEHLRCHTYDRLSSKVNVTATTEITNNIFQTNINMAFIVIF